MSTLSPKRWQEISPHLDEVLSLPEEERARWLNTFRTEKPELVDLLQELLQEQQAVVQRNRLWQGKSLAPTGSFLP